MTELLLKILVIVIIGYILYLSFTTSNVRSKEGFTNPFSTSSSTSSTTASSNNTSTSTNGVAGNITAYESSINSQSTKLKDALVVTTYSTNYTDLVSEDLPVYTTLLALNTLLNITQGEINKNDITPSLEKFNTYMSAITNFQTINNLLNSKP